MDDTDKGGNFSVYKGKRPGTYIFYPQWVGFSLAYLTRMTPHLCWYTANQKCNWYPSPTCPVSEGYPSVLNPPLSLVGCYVGEAQTAGPSHFSRCGLGVWGGFHTHMWEGGIFWPGTQPFHVAHYDMVWQGHPYFSLIHVILRTQHYIYCRRCSTRRCST